MFDVNLTQINALQSPRSIAHDFSQGSKMNNEQ